MTLNEMIYQRKSCRSFTDRPVDAEMIEAIRSFEPKPLYPRIKFRMEIVSWDKIRHVCPCAWTASQVIVMYSEETEGYPENSGFLLQQTDLYLQTLGLGVCWFGIGRLKDETVPAADGMKFIIMLAFGYPEGDQLRHDLRDFNRKPMAQITDKIDPRLESARLAPSACNSQPWYFTHDADVIHVHCSREGGGLHAGIALAHLYVENQERFRFFKTEHMTDLPGYGYIGSVML